MSPCSQCGIGIYRTALDGDSNQSPQGRKTHVGNKALFHDKVPNVKGTVTAPAKAHASFAGLFVNETVLYEEFVKTRENFGKCGRDIDLLLLGIKIRVSGQRT